MRKNILVILVLTLVIRVNPSLAGNVLTNARIEEPSFTSAALTVKYDKYSLLPSVQPNFSKGIFEVGIDETKKIFHSQEFTSVVTITYNYEDFSLNNSGPLVQVFTVNYDPVQKYTPQSFYLIQNAASISVQNIDVVTYSNYGLPGQSVVSNPGDLYIEASIDADETPAFNFNTSLPLSSNMGYNIIYAGSVASDMEVFWDYIQGAEYYEMEYLHVDDYDGSSLPSSKSPNALEYDFLHDATRIVTNNQYYRIPLVYERGYILFRVRGVSRSPLNSNVRLEGTWSNAGFEISDIGTYSANFPNQVFAVAAHEFDNVNWQCSKTFAEKGRSGTGVEYLDALSKSRQTLAKLNSENKTIVQSTLYDWYGRPAVSVLPSPINETYFSFKQDLNKTTTGALFDKAIFDNVANSLNGNICAPDGLRMSSIQSAGAAKYYSPNNPDKEGAQALVPDADGYPYIQIEYYPDQNNRVKRQSNAGNAHFLGSNREAFYNYTQPTQKELCRLFGTEVGRYDEYEKLTTIDPNGQISVSYSDDMGRTIATGLYGANPANVVPIEGALDPASNITTPLVNNLDDPQNFVLEIGNTFFAAAGETQSINYDVTVPVYNDANCSPNLCMDCIYELEISVKDQCGLEILDGDLTTPGNQPVTAVLGRYDPNVSVPYSVSCPAPNASLKFNFGTTLAPFTFNVPANGTYYLTKKLKLSTLPLQYYAQQYINSNSNTCVTSLSSFQNDALQDIDITNCQNFDCANCTTAVMTAVSTMSPPLSQTQIDLLIEKCNLKCDMKNVCKSREKLMLMHFKPGGYFAKYNTGGPNYASNSIYSIFNPGNNLGTILQINPSSSYAYNNVPLPGYGGYTINDPQTNQPVSPDQLSIINYVATYNSQFSKPWLQWHPEYCKLQFYCDGLVSAILSYSDALSQANSYNDACIQGLLYPFPSALGIPSSPPLGNCPNGCTPGANQYIPLVNYSGSTHFSVGQINSLLSSFTQSFTNTTYNHTSGTITANLYEYAVAASNSLMLNPGALPHLGNAGNCDIDFEWLTYKSFYMSLLQNLIYDLRTTFVNSWSTSNGGCMTDNQLSNLPLYIPVFENPTLANYPVIPSIPSISATPTVVLSGNAQSNIQASCQSFCQSYVNNWLNDLAPCGIVPGPTWNAIQNDLVAVCAAGCDSQDPFGASNTNGAIPISTGGTAMNFQDVLNAHGFGANPNCNSFLISWPKAKGTSLGQNSGSSPNGTMPAGTPTIDACSCDKIRNTHDDYINAVNSSQINPCTLSENAYFQQTLGVNLPNLSTYTCICDQAYDSNSGTYNFGSVTSVPSVSLTILAVPPSLGCSNCIPCSTFGSVVPLSGIFDGGMSNIGITSYAALTAANQTVVVNYLNSTYNMNNTYDEWMSFFDDCLNNHDAATGQFSGNAGITNLTSNEAYAMSSLFNQLYSMGYLNLNTISTSYTLNQGNAASFFNSSIWTLPSAPSTTAEVVVSNSAGNLLVHIFNQASTYNCQFTIPLPVGISPSAVGTLSGLSIKTLKGMCDASGNAILTYWASFNYYDLTTNTNVTATITIGNTCFNSLVTPNVPNASCQPYLCSNSLSGGTPGSSPATNSTSCLAMQINNALNQAQTNYNNYIQGVIEDFIAAYKDHCYANVTESFERGYFLNEYQYTLYYYDRAGNLVHTVPPGGVQVLSGTPLSNATSYVVSGSGSPVYPAHSLNQTSGTDSYVSHYAFNSLNQVVKSVTPDDGESIYFYDHVGRVVASQNAQQLIDNTYSYTLYDNLGRITEAGVLNNITATLASSITLNPIRWQNYLAGLTKSEVLHSVYDETINLTVDAYFPGGQKLLKNRVSATTSEQVDDGDPNTYDNATFYSYDDHGNASYIVQEKTNDYLKTLEYEYELVSGNVNKFIYNRGFIDQLFTAYHYDADNRLSEALTSQNGTVYQKDAKYFYYEHGPLARTEIGEKQVQAKDYAYTLLGWIKGMNSNILSPATDMGKDGDPGNSYFSAQNGIHGNFAKDAASYSLHYFEDDYLPIKSAAASFLANRSPLNSGSAAGFKTGNDAPDLYNGNIASMVTSIYDMNVLSKDLGLPKPQVTGYKYDQLQRIRHMKAYSSLCINTTNSSEYSEAIDLTTNQWEIPSAGNYAGSYEMNFGYDKMGNITNLERKGDAQYTSGWNVKTMDNLTYNYQNAAGILTSVGTFQTNNQLTHVNDDLAIPPTNYADDVEDQLTNNYTYNARGSLTQDLAEEIQTIEWTAFNKVKNIFRTTGSTKPDLHYQYDAFGRRIYKKTAYKTPGGLPDPSHFKETFYVLDVTGNTLGVYERLTSGASVSNLCKELYLYGSGKLGCIHTDADMSLPLPTTTYALAFGAKEYELTNHLQNVITTFSDRKRGIDGLYQFVGNSAGNYNFDGYTYVPVAAGTGVFNQTMSPDGTIDTYFCDISSTADYYAGGMPMPGRSWTGGGDYRYSHNGHEREDELAKGLQSAEYWMYDSRIIRRWEKDPVTFEWQSPYVCFDNNPIYFSDLLGAASGTQNPEFVKNTSLKQPEIIKHNTGTWNSGKTSPNISGEDSGLSEMSNPDVQINIAQSDATRVNMPDMPNSSTNRAPDYFSGGRNRFIDMINHVDMLMYSLTSNNIWWGTGQGGQPKYGSIQGIKGSIHTFDFAGWLEGWAFRSKINGGLPTDVRNSSGKGLDKANEFGKNETYGQNQTDCSGWHEISTGNKPALKLIDKDSTSKIPPGTGSNQTNDTLYLIYDRGNTKDAKSVILGKTKIQ